jgi:anti-sigma B factor antagonist
MKMEFQKIDNIIILYFKGRIDAYLSANIEQEINKLFVKETTCNFIFNLAETEYLSSSGLRILVSTIRILKENGRILVLCNMNKAVKNIFRVVEIMDMFTIFETEKEAINFLQKR